MSSDLHKRNKGLNKKGGPKPFDQEDRKKLHTEPGSVELQPDIKVVIALVLAFAVLTGAFIYYKIDSRTDGPFAMFVNSNVVGSFRKLMPANRYQKKGM